MTPLTRARQSLAGLSSSGKTIQYDSRYSNKIEYPDSRDCRTSQSSSTPTKAHFLSSPMKTRAAFQRTQSSPDPYSTYSALSMESSSAKPRARSSSIASSMHSSRSHQKRPASDHHGVDDEEDHPDDSRQGGCSQSLPVRGSDTSNKENIAPACRLLSILDRQQEETVTEMEQSRQRLPIDGLTGRSDATSSIFSSTPRRSQRARQRAASVRGDLPGTIMPASSNRQTLRKRKRCRNANTEVEGVASVEENFTAALDLAQGPALPQTYASFYLERQTDGIDEELSAPSSQSTGCSRIFDIAPVPSRQDGMSESGYSSPESEIPSDDEFLRIGWGTTLHRSIESEGASERKKEAAAAVAFDNVYAHARSLLRYGTSFEEVLTTEDKSAPNVTFDQDVQIVGRDKERAALVDFIEGRLCVSAYDCKTNGTAPLPDVPGCFYIAGMPGTGKTALVRSTLASLQARAQNVRIAFINCVALSQPRFIFAAILAALGVPTYSATNLERDPDPVARRAQDDLNSYLKDSARSEKILVVLDEVDHLSSKGTRQTILERVFRLFHTPSTGASTAMISIANSLDLMEALTQLFKISGRTFECQSFSMSPFSATELQAIVRSRLAGLHERYDDRGGANAIAPCEGGRAVIISPSALMLAARSIAGPNGDLRRMLDTCRVAIDLVEAEQRRLAVELGTNAMCPIPMTGSEASRLLSHLTPTSAPVVGPTQIAEAMQPIRGGAIKDIKTVRKLLLHDKLLLLSLLVCTERIKAGLKVPLPSLGDGSSTAREYIRFQSPGVSFDDLYDTYTSILTRDGTFDPMEPSDLRVLLDTKLQSTGLVVWRDSVLLAAKTARGVMSVGARLATRRVNAAGRAIALAAAVAAEDVLKGLRSVAASGAGGSQASAEAISRIWAAESDRIEKAKGFDVIAQEIRSVRGEELGGGRMAVADTL